ncbi:MAG TPA: phosphate signaling complex protein PhoU [Mycobacteriales bacterium]|nr:phosphate signaling complex protein PhoU [Mycobacteriales bacterium]
MPRVRFHDQIETALAEIVEMICLVDAAVEQVTESLLTGDIRLAETVISQDDAIDALYRKLELAIHEMFARQAPVAGDLRALIAIIRMIGDLERSGDLALNIAKTVRRIYPLELPAGCGPTVARMGEQARILLQGAAQSVRDLEPDTAERLDLMDDVMDELSVEMFRALADPAAGVEVETAMHLALVTRYYERIADHAVSVAERVEFLVTGSAHESHVGL